MQHIVRIAVMPSHLVHLVAAAETVMQRVGTAPCGILPLRLGGQPEGQSGHRTQLLQKPQRIVPRYIVGGEVVAFAVLFRPVQIIAHDRAPLTLGDFEPAEVEVAQGHLVHGTLVVARLRVIIVGLGVTVLRTHSISSTRYVHQIRDQVPHHGFLLLAELHRVRPVDEDPVDVFHLCEIVMLIKVVPLLKNRIFPAKGKEKPHRKKESYPCTFIPISFHPFHCLFFILHS